MKSRHYYVVISDYLGSARVTLSTTAEPLQSSSYHPYGTERTSTGSGARTSYIGREHDNETDLGFFGVRLYEPEYGRFLSTDVLWAKYLPLQPYQYAGNEPVGKYDNNGKEITPINLSQEQISVLNRFIAVLRRAKDPYIDMVLDFAEGCNSTIHLYSFPRNTEVESSTKSHLYMGETTLEQFWERSGASGMTIHNDRMKLANQADMILASDNVFGQPPDGQALLAVLDELNHVFQAKGSEVDHVQLYRFLLNVIQSSPTALPVDVELVKRLLERAIEELGPQQPNIDDGPALDPNVEPPKGN